MTLKLKKKHLLMFTAIVCIVVDIGTVYAAQKQVTANNDKLVWYNGKQAITYSISKSVSPVGTVA